MADTGWILLCSGEVMSLNDIVNYLGFTRNQKLDLILTILLPVVSGVIIVIALKPSMASDASASNLCLLGFIAILPVWLLNILIWSVLGVRLIRDIAKHAVGLAELPDESKDFVKSIISEAPMLSTFLGVDPFRYIASVVTAFSSYVAGGFIYFAKTSLPMAYVILIVISCLPAVLWTLCIRKAVAQLKIDDLRHLWKKVIADKEFREHIIRRIDKIERIIKEKKARGQGSGAKKEMEETP
jgi:hypothetical protein